MMTNNYGKQPKPDQGQNLIMNFPPSQVSLDLPAFDRLLRSQGIKIKHFKALPDPTRLQSRGDIRRSGPISDTDGMLYKEAGCFTGTFQSNDKLESYQVEGQIDVSQATITPPRFYDDTEKQIYINVNDRFQFADIEIRVVANHLQEASPLGRDRLAYKAICVEHLIGNDGFEYKEGVHFKINSEGEIEWVTNQRPSINLETGKGDIYSVRYLYIPFFVVRRLLHETRVAQVTNGQGVRYVERLPYQVQVARENVYRDQRVISEAPEADPRFQDLPSYGNLYGPRGS